MENQEIMTTFEDVEVADVVEVSSGNGLKYVGGVLALAGLAYGGYKLFKRHKAKKEQAQVVEVIECDSDVCDVVDE